jgi:hypothetical protein
MMPTWLTFVVACRTSSAHDDQQSKPLGESTMSDQPTVINDLGLLGV